MRDHREPIEVFYADPVDEHGNVIATASMSITHSSGRPAVVTKVPHSELAHEDMPTIRVDEEDFPS